MQGAIRGLDHAVVAVRDLQRAAATYSRLGFTLTPRGRHSAGSENHCIMFGSDYLELLAPPAEGALGHYAEFLAGGEGLAGIALRSEDAAGDHRALLAAGIGPEPPLELSRPVHLPEGDREASFRLVQLPSGAAPGCRLFLCQHLTPELVWRREWQRQALGVTGIAGVALVAAEPQRLAHAYGAVLGEAPRAAEDGWLLDAGSARMLFATRTRLARRLEGVRLAVRGRPFAAALFLHVSNRVRLERELRVRGFRPVELADGSFAVHAVDAHGVALVFG